jgi:hypothetical protein
LLVVVAVVVFVVAKLPNLVLAELSYMTSTTSVTSTQPQQHHQQHHWHHQRHQQQQTTAPMMTPTTVVLAANICSGNKTPIEINSLLRCVKVMVTFINLASPCLVKADHQNAINKVVGHLMAENPETSVALLVNPHFSYRKNTLWLEEHAVLKGLTNAGCNCDRKFSLLFDEKTVPCLALLSIETV